MTPVFLFIISTGQIWVGDNPTPPAGTITQSFRINSLSGNQLICTLTGSGNASASGLAASLTGANGKKGTGEGNEIH
jgi:hypothetical protein